MRRAFLYPAHFFDSLSSSSWPLSRDLSPSVDPLLDPLRDSDCLSMITEELKTWHLSPSKQEEKALSGVLTARTLQ
jgi:hypothetical protein